MLTVLTVDRSQVVRAVVERHLARYGCATCEATTLEEALAAVRAHRPALMLVDAAVHAAAGRCSEPMYAAVPVVLLTTDHPASARHGDDPQVVAVLRKPFDQSAFDRAVHTVLGAPRAHVAGARDVALEGPR